MGPYIAHWIEEKNQIQTVFEHCLNTAFLARARCPIPFLAEIAWIAGMLHDAGKTSDDFQRYLRASVKKETVRRGEVDHATTGGRLIEKELPQTLLSTMIQTAIYSHHGLYDCIAPETGKSLFERRMRTEFDTSQSEERFRTICDFDELHEHCIQAQASLNALKSNVMDFEKQKNVPPQYGNPKFFLGMYERILTSLLIEGDRTDTANFMEERAGNPIKSKETMQKTWQQCMAHCEAYIDAFPVKNPIDEARKYISNACKNAAESPNKLYRLTVPTGAGKTLSSLRFSLQHAHQYGKRHIIYVAPFHSILEQNAEEIRKALGQPALVLEHHSNVLQLDEESEKKYDILTENWESEVVLTTAVQFLNTLFSSGTSNVRRMYSLCNSIVLFDEIQALPVRIMELFNLAVNFLTEFCDSTVVLCSATQPLLDRLPTNRLMPATNMVENLDHYEGLFKRTTLIDQTNRMPSGLSVEELGDFVAEQFPVEQQILVIVNTKACAKNLYDDLKQRYDSDVCQIFHLSTNMYAADREKRLEGIKQALLDQKPLICVSTQLIEAGVDLSFRCAIRSLAGLDNVIQAAGRCNRHGERKNGNVHIVKLSTQAENSSRIKDIQEAQSAMESLLFEFREAPEHFDNRLDSIQAMNRYYEWYFNRRKEEMKYNVSIGGAQGNLVDLLSANDMGRDEYRRNYGKAAKSPLQQAFKTAGDLFQVIPEDAKIDVVVSIDEEAKEAIGLLEKPNRPFSEQKRCLRELQRYTVGISESFKRRLSNAVYLGGNGKVLLLNPDYYDEETGVSETPKMSFMES